MSRERGLPEVRESYRPGKRVTVHLGVWFRHDHPITDTALCRFVDEQSGCGLRFWGKVEAQSGAWPPEKAFSITFEGQIDPFAPGGRYECQLMRVETADGSYLTLPRAENTYIGVLPSALKKHTKAKIDERVFA